MKKKVIILIITIFFVLSSLSPIISGLKIQTQNNETKDLQNKNNENNKEKNYYYNNLRAEADFTYSPRYPDPGEEITFTSKSYCYGNGWITSIRWDFDDGQYQYGKTAKYTFENKGEFKVTLRVEARGWSYYYDHYYYDWGSDYCTRYIDVGADPFPKFSISNTKPAPGENITFDASESSDPDGEIVSYNWSYYNTETPENIVFLGNKTIIEHRWDEQGVYNITLRVEDNKGNINYIEKTVKISILKIREITDNFDEINIEIFNQGNIAAKNLTCDIEINRYATFNFMSKQYYKYNDSVEILKSKEHKNITIKDLEGYGGFIIDITADADNAIEVSKSKFGYIIGEQIFLSDFEINKINRLRWMIRFGTVVTVTIILGSMFIKAISSNSE
jgi:plastocyanin